MKKRTLMDFLGRKGILRYKYGNRFVDGFRTLPETLGSSLKMESQSLLVPLLAKVEPRDRELAMRHVSELHAAVWEIDVFGSGIIQILSMPAFYMIVA